MKFFGTTALLIAIFVTGFASPSNAVPVKVSAPTALVAAQLKTSTSPEDKLFGVMDDNLVMCDSVQAGFNVVKRTIWISPSNNRWDNPSGDQRISSIPKSYQSSIMATFAEAKACNQRVIVELYPVTQFGPPTRPGQMRGSCDLANDITKHLYDAGYADQLYGWEIGVEPNNYTFAHQQFNPDGTQASAAIYERWLSTCYDKIKAEHPELKVIGLSLASSGEDDPGKKTSSTSPVLFIQKFCEALVSDGRTKPNMDIADIHSYPVKPDEDPTVAHPWPSTTITIADNQKLDQVLGCFPAKAGIPKPEYIWGEGGYNTAVPDGRPGYRNKKPSSVPLLDEATQGRYIATEIKMAYCQPHSIGFINLHFVDDPDRASNWQSGVAYAPGGRRKTSGAAAGYTLKQSITPVRKELSAASSGTIDCETPGLP